MNAATAPAMTQERFHELIEGIGDLSARSSSKYTSVEQQLEEWLRAPVRAKYVSASKMINNRINELATARTNVALFLVNEPSLIAPTCKHAEARVGTGRSFEVALIADNTSGSWKINRLVADPLGAPAREILRVFPDAELLKPPPATLREPTGTYSPPPPSVVPLQLDDRVLRMARLAIASSNAVMLVGPPGTGKTTILRHLVEQARIDPAKFGLSTVPSEPVWATPEESWTTRELAGGQSVDDQGRLRFRPGLLLEAIREDRWLILDEANRADMDKIFGALLTWLSGHGVRLGQASPDVGAPVVTLQWGESAESTVGGLSSLTTEGGADPVIYSAGRDWRLLGTYNAVDAQRVFKFGQALGRRFSRVPIPPASPEALSRMLEPVGSNVPQQLRKALVGLYALHLEDEATAVGPGLFLKAFDYVRTAFTLDEVQDAESVFAEGYLAALGTQLSRLEPELLDALADKASEAGLLPQEQWQWIKSLLPTLS